jgi:hypothetical protein
MAAATGSNAFAAVWSGFDPITSMDLRAQRYRTTTPLTAPNPPSVAAVSSSQLGLTWEAISGPSLSRYELFIDGATLGQPVTAAEYQLNGLAPESTHTFRLAYVLTDGRRSLPSSMVSGTTMAGSGSEAAGGGAGADEGVTPGSGDGDGLAVLRARIAMSGAVMELSWNTVPGRRYQVQISDDLERWMDAGGPREALGAADRLELLPKEKALWYRIVELP